jgi:hypothetical protein
MAEVLNIVRTVITVLSFLGTIVVCIAGWYAWKKITGNHLHHIDLDIKDLQTENKEIRKELNNQGEDISWIRGYLTKEK